MSERLERDNMTLLIVDDEIFAIQGIMADIKKENLKIDTILTANSYAQAVNIFLQQEIHILLCDIEMPYGTGIDLVEWVKKTYPETECIFLTCHDEFHFAKQAVQLKCLDYVLKPATAETLNNVLKRGVGEIQKNRKEKVYKDYGKIYIDNISKPDTENTISGKDAVRQTEEYIRKHIEENLSIEILASNVFLSSAYLSRLFKKKYNMTLVDYITWERMKLAKELLENEDLTITMISARTGYSNYSYFTKMFKKTYDKTPREYRQQFL